VAVFLTAGLGYRIYTATQESTRIVTMTAAFDPSSAQELQAQFRANDRVVLWSILGFGAVLVMAVAAAGIWMTHKIAGPLHNIARALGRIRDNKLPADLGHLRKGDQLQAFHTTVREMYDAVRGRVVRDAEVLDKAIAAIEAEPSRSAALDQVAAELRHVHEEKARSLNS